MTAPPTPHSHHLTALARRVTQPYVDAGAVAAMVVGSVAEGLSDEWSDIDLILFYDVLPDDEVLASAREGLGGGDHVVLGDDRDGGALLEQFRVEGVACQLVHQTVAAWEQQAASVLVDLDTASPLQKALTGLHEGVVLHGDPLVERLRAAAVYPTALARAMVENHLDVFPLWRLQDALASRDAVLWQHGELVAGFQRVLAILAGVNRQWFSPFQLKRVDRLAASFTHAPPRLAARIDAALTAPMPAAAAELEALVAETLDIVEARLPDVDVSRLRRSVGGRVRPWQLPPQPHR